jgi:site-specific recombinase XerD
VLELMCEKAGDEPISSITSKVIRKAMDRRRDKPEAANTLLKALRCRFAFALEKEHATVDLTADIRKLRSKNPEGWHTWTIGEARRFEERHPVGSKARLALALLPYTGARRSDVVTLIGRQHIREGLLNSTPTRAGCAGTSRSRDPGAAGSAADHRRDA